MQKINTLILRLESLGWKQAKQINGIKPCVPNNRVASVFGNRG